MGDTHDKLWATLTWPNRISLLRLLLLIPFLLLLMSQNRQGYEWARYAAMGVFALMAVSDWLDGLLARRLHERSRLGAILDPIADKAMIISSVIILSIPSTSVPGARLDSWVVLSVVAKDLWVITGFVVVYLVTDRFRVHPTWAGKLCTLAQVMLLAATLLAPDINRAWSDAGSRLSWAAGIAVVVTSAMAVVSYTRLGLSFIMHEEKPLETTPPGILPPRRRERGKQ